ncbi:MAG: hypothetical protein DMG76_29805 [Acidobacteria bacterium]|nr:MAG: hypothetical protein DMG76_29805 [Acidobacteriota bacterium]
MTAAWGWIKMRLVLRGVGWFVGLLSIFAPMVAHAQPWSGILSLSRAADWSTAGATITNRTTQCGATIASYAGPADTINNAIAACPSGQFVQLGSGTFTLSTGLVFAKSGVTLRGSGPALTKLVINGNVSRCSLFYKAAISMCTGSGNIGNSSGGGPGPTHTATWTAGYIQGTTVVTLSSTTGLAVGSTIFLDQLDDASDGWPATGDLYICSGSSPCSNQGGGSWPRSGRTQTEVHRVTSITGSAVTVTPPIRTPNFRAGQSPGAWWGNTSEVLTDSGIENLTYDFSGGGATGLLMVNATNCWIKNVRAIFTSGPGSFVFHVAIINGFQITTRDSYFYGPTVQGNTQYAYTPHVAGSLLLENNIFHHNVSAMIPNDPETGSVYAYNYVNDLFYSGAVQLHSAGSMMNLYEGNNLPSYLGDILHGPHYFETLFRNHMDGYAHNPQQVNENSGVMLLTHNRFFNLIGNVIGDSHFTTYETDLTSNQNAIFSFGFQGTGSGTTISNDTNVGRTVMRWGNWDNVTNTTRFVSAEVPSGITNFSNQVPGIQILPPSFYLPAQPPWWSTASGTPPWPAVGPEVTGGNIAGYAGHAYKIPARLCFEKATVDPAYPNSNPRILLFDASTCYGQSGQAVPTAPLLRVQ